MRSNSSNKYTQGKARKIIPELVSVRGNKNKLQKEIAQFIFEVISVLNIIKTQSHDSIFRADMNLRNYRDKSDIKDTIIMDKMLDFMFDIIVCYQRVY